MKTAIYIEEELRQEADRTAREMGLSRSRLYSIALQDFLKQRRQAAILEQLNRADADGRDSGRTSSARWDESGVVAMHSSTAS